MNWMRKVMSMLYMSAVFGGTLWLLWMSACCVLRRYGNARLIHRLLRCVIPGYLLPVLLFFRWYREAAGGAQELPYMIGGHIKILFSIWCTGAMGVMAWQLLRWRRFQRMLRSRIPVRREECLMLGKLRRQMRIRRPIRMYRSYGILSPCIYGFLRPRLVLPVMPLQKKQLEMILVHELTHFKQGDLFWKPVFAILNGIFWFSPCAWLAARQICRWAEASCDEICCRRYPVRLYFGMMSELLLGGGNRPPEFVSLWTESFSEFRWRSACAMRNARAGRRGRIVTAAVTMLFLAGAGAAIYIFCVYAETVYAIVCR